MQLNEKFKYIYTRLTTDNDGGTPRFENFTPDNLEDLKRHVRNEASDMVTALCAAAYDKAVYDISCLPEIEIHIKD